MPKRTRKERELDENQLAHHLVRMSTKEKGPVLLPKQSEISRVMAAMGHRGGKIGGKLSLITMTSKERRERASRAAKARWAKRKKR